MNQSSPIAVKQAQHLIAQGQNSVDIAPQVGVSARTVDRIKKRDADKIEQLAQRYIEKSIKPIEDLHYKTLNLANDILDATSKPDDTKLQVIADIRKAGLEPKDILTLADKKEFRALQIMGIAPANTRGIVINKLYSQTNITTLDPEVARAFTDQAHSMVDVIDCDYRVLADTDGATDE